jgi:hypothetical protein
LYTFSKILEKTCLLPSWAFLSTQVEKW